VFGHSGEAQATFTAKESQLSDRMQSYWGAFAASANPNSVNQATAWPKYNDDTRPRIVFDTSATLKTNTKYRAKECNFWNTAYGVAGSVLGGKINELVREISQVQEKVAQQYLF
jgi:carboxylesterase type B